MYYLLVTYIYRMEDTRDFQDMPNNFGEMDKHDIKNAMKDLTEEQLNEQLFGKDVLDIAEALKYAVADDKNIDKALEKIEMESMKQCKEQGEIFKTATYMKRNVQYICLKGK